MIIVREENDVDNVVADKEGTEGREKDDDEDTKAVLKLLAEVVEELKKGVKTNLG